MTRPRHGIGIATLVLLLAACTATSSPDASPSLDSPSDTPSLTATPAPTPTPEPTPEPDIEVPLAVVTGYTNLKSTITADEVAAAIEADTMIQNCELFPAANPGPRCLPADEITAHLGASPTDLAMLPWHLVTPIVKVLPVDGADLFGSEEARTSPYPYVASVSPDLGWEPYEVERIRTVISPGNMCHDRGPAYAAITLGRGWDWVFGGGTAVYDGFNAPGGVSTINVVPTGNEGAMAALLRSGDVTIAEIECPFVDDWTVNNGTIFSLDPATIPLLRDTYGADVILFAANHPFDQGTEGFIESLEHFEANGLPYAGAGRNLEEALTPATVEVNGLTFGFTGHNEIPGPIPAGPNQPGVLWLTDEYHVTESVRRAREVADVVLCVPQWWGGEEYHYDWRPSQRQQQEAYFEAGCDHILGQGTHYAGPMDLEFDESGRARLTVMSSGNFLFGQGWSQDTMEGVVFELTFRDADLVQARMHPYVTMDQAQTNLLDPEGDGRYVLQRIFEHSADDLANAVP
ncbi:MAG TPA: CapA family protein [Candidatus Angelobacter sp.]|nr:CapA family protein [Candidatus Angelobacter sp.]